MCPKRYVDDIFCLFKNSQHIQSFLVYLNSQHPNINFTFETEADDALPFLEVNVFRSESGFITSIYRKPTFSGIYTNYDSFIPDLYKRNLVSTLLFRAFKICSSWDLIHKEVVGLKLIMQRNGYPTCFTEKLVTIFFDKMKQTKAVITTVPKQKFIIVLPYLGSVSIKVKRNLEMLQKKYLPAGDIYVIFRSPSKLRSVFSFKDKLPAHLVSGVIYQYTCGRCKSTYIGKTKRHVLHRFSEHAGVSPLTGKKLKGQQSTTVRDHMLTCDTIVDSGDFKIIGRDSNNHYLRIKESLFIIKEGPSLNIQGKSIPLTLF